MRRLRVLDLFSGIGGFTLGLERAGMETIAFCEIDIFCRQVLKKNWPDVPVYNDIRELTKDDIPGPVDIICGGFPCQDVSVSGKRQGLSSGTRSGLWSEQIRLIREVKPAAAIIENVPGLLTCNKGGGHSPGCSVSWPKAGLMRNGFVYRRQQLVRVTTEKGCGLLHTPLAQSWKTWTLRNPYALIRKGHAPCNLQEQLMQRFRRMLTSRCAEIMMMYPERWNDLSSTGMLSSRKSLK